LLPRGRIPDQDLLVPASTDNFGTIRAEAHGADTVRVPPQWPLDFERLGIIHVNHLVAPPRCQPLPAGAPRHGSHSVGVSLQGAQNFLPRLCADEVYAPIIITRRDDVTGGPVLHAFNSRVQARRAPAARPEVVPQDQIHHVGLAVEQGVETRAQDDARAVAVPGCTACSAVARARRHVPLPRGQRRAGGSVLRRAPRRRGGVPPPPVRGATAAALGGPPPKAFGAGEFRTALNTRKARHCAARRWPALAGGRAQLGLQLAGV